MDGPVGSLAAAVGLGVVSVLVARALLAVVGRLPEPAEVDVVEGEPPKPPWRDLAVEPRWRRGVLLLAGVLGLVLGAATGVAWELLLVAPLAPVGAVLALVDVRTRLLPKRLVWPATAAAAAYGLAAWAVTGQVGDLVVAVGGAVLAWALLGVLWVWAPSGLGFGDVRMVGWLGFVLAHLGPTAYVVGLYAPFVLFAVPGLLLALVRRDRSLLRRAYPFGPFLVAGAVVGVVVGG